MLTFDDGFSECFTIVRHLLLKHKIPCIFCISTNFIDNKSMFYRNKISLCVEEINCLDNSQINKTIRIINKAFGKRLENKKSLVQWLMYLNLDHDEIIDKVCNILGVDIEEYLMAHRPYLTSDQIRLLSSDGFTIGTHGRKHQKLSLLSSEDEMEKEVVNSCRKILHLSGADSDPFAFPHSGEGIHQAFIERLISKYKFIRVFLDTGNFKENSAFIVNRIILDNPRFSVGREFKSTYLKHL